MGFARAQHAALARGRDLEVLDGLNSKARDRAFKIFSTDLEDAAIVHIGRGDAADPSFTRLVRIVKDPAVRRMVRPKAAETDVPRRLRAVAVS